MGLGQDELGYFVPEYDFQLDDRLPWFESPEGDHYEETRSLGPDTIELLTAEIDKIMAWEAAN